MKLKGTQLSTNVTLPSRQDGETGVRRGEELSQNGFTRQAEFVIYTSNYISN